MTKEWVEYKEGSAVQTAIAMATGLKDQGASLILMHQGAEETMPTGDLANFLTYDGRNLSSYNPAKGMMGVRESMAGFASRYLGLPANAQNTFWMQNNGRQEMRNAYQMVNIPLVKAGLKPVGAAPDMFWPMVWDNAVDYGLSEKLVHYDLKRNQVASNVETVLMHNPLTSTVYVNTPANPSGYIMAQSEAQDLVSAMDAHNDSKSIPNKHSTEKQIEFPTVLIDDNPYFAGLPQKDTGAFLTSPFEGIKMNGATPSVHIISLSKAFGTAQPGASIVVFTNDQMAAAYGKMIASGSGPSFDSNNAINLAALFEEKNDPLIRAHLSFLFDKYTANYQHVKANLEEYIVPGDAGMVSTIKIPKEALNKLVKCKDGVEREITSGRKVAEYIANTYDVVTVDQSDVNNAMLRLALKSEDESKIAEGTANIAKAIEDLKNAPSLDMAV